MRQVAQFPSRQAYSRHHDLAPTKDTAGSSGDPWLALQERGNRCVDRRARRRMNNRCLPRFYRMMLSVMIANVTFECNTTILWITEKT